MLQLLILVAAWPDLLSWLRACERALAPVIGRLDGIMAGRLLIALVGSDSVMAILLNFHLMAGIVRRHAVGTAVLALSCLLLGRPAVAQGASHAAVRAVPGPGVGARVGVQPGTGARRLHQWGCDPSRPRGD